MRVPLAEYVNKYARNERYQKLFTEAKKSGAVKTTAWWYRKIKKGYFHSQTRNLTEDAVLVIANQIDDMITELNQIYGDNWDFNFYLSTRNSGNKKPQIIANIVILFPEIEISNSQGDTHIIKDLVVSMAIEFLAGSIIIYDLVGGRATLDYTEYKACYMHSHLIRQNLNEDSIFPVSNFCLGESEITNVLQELSNVYSSDRFTMLLLMINDFVRWESLEGVPYLELAHIQRALAHIEVNLNHFNSQYFYYKTFIEDVKKIINEHNLDFCYKNGKFTIVSGPHTEAFYRVLIENKRNEEEADDQVWGLGRERGLLVKKGNKYLMTDSIYPPNQEDLNHDVNPTNKYLLLGDREIVQTIVINESLKAPQENEMQTVINPKLIEFGNEILEKRIQFKRIREKASKQLA